MRKNLAILSLVCILAFSGCKNTGSGSESKETTTKTETTTEEATTLKTVSLDEIHSKVKEAYGENYLPNVQYDDATLEQLMGITKDMYAEYVAEAPRNSVNADLFIAIKPAEGKNEQVLDMLTKYHEKLVEGSRTYPMNIEKINAAKVFEKGGYVFYICLGVVDDDLEDQARFDACEKENQKAIDVIDSLF